MIEFSLDAVPNQSFTANIEENRYIITLKEARGIMAATVVRNDETIVQSARVVAGTPIIPYIYLEDGNFFITTLEDDLPDWTKFGVSQSFAYITKAEIEAANGSP